MKHLVIGDPHAKPGVSNERFAWAAHFAIEERPDVIINMGDMGDMPSLCSYDKNTKSFEGRRYQKDVAAVRDALATFAKPFADHNHKYPKDQYNPRMLMLGGNHDEARIARVSEMHPELDGLISIADLGYEEFGWEYQPFLKPIVVHGIVYNHYFPSGLKNLPIGGPNGARMLLAKKHTSCVAGHNHLRDFAEDMCGDGKKIGAVMSGCYFEHREGYAGGANDMWWRGLIILDEIKDGFFDPRFYRIQTIKRIYG